MAIGDIGGRLDYFQSAFTWSSETATVKLSDGYVAVVTCINAIDAGYIMTFHVDEDGIIDETPVDFWYLGFDQGGDFNSRYRFRKLAGNIYLIASGAYQDDYLRIFTVEISPVGVITKSFIDFYEDSSTTMASGGFKGLEKLGESNTYAIIYTDRAVPDYTPYQTYLRTFTVDADGTNITMVDSWMMQDATRYVFGSFILRDNILIITYVDTNDNKFYISTVRISNDGTIAKVIIHSKNVLTSSATSYPLLLESIYQNIILLHKTYTAFVYTYSVSSLGVISDQISSLVSAGDTHKEYTRIFSLGDDGSKIHVLMVYKAQGDTDGYYLTLTMDMDGSDLASNQVVEVYNSTFSVAGDTVEVRDDIWYTPFNGGSNNLYMLTADCESGSFSTVSDKRITGIRHIYRPGSYRAEINFGGVSLTSGIVKKQLLLPTAKEAEETGAEPVQETITVPEKTATELEGMWAEPYLTQEEYDAALKKNTQEILRRQQGVNYNLPAVPAIQTEALKFGVEKVLPGIMNTWNKLKSIWQSFWD